jgi:hypothetical protein
MEPSRELVHRHAESTAPRAFPAPPSQMISWGDEDGAVVDGLADPKTSESSKRGSLGVQPDAAAPTTNAPSINGERIW